MEIPQDIRKLIEEYKLWYQSIQPKEGVQCIRVDEVAAKVASFYEKIRGVVDWREEHLLRKTAIERILKRRMLLAAGKEDFAEPFLQELIRGGHFPNERIPLQKIEEIQVIVEKYFYLLEQSSKEGTEKVLQELRLWLLGIAAAEIEETLAPPIREKALIGFMAGDMEQKVKLRYGKALSKEELSTQISIAVQRALFKLDESTITYHLLERWYLDWENPSSQTLSSLAQDLPKLKETLAHTLHHPLSERLYQTMEQHDTPYLIVGDILGENPKAFENLLSDPPALEAAVRKVYQARLGKLKGRMHRAAVYSTISVFLSKVLVALAIEIPFDRYITGDFNKNAIAMSIVIPSLFMLFLVATIKTTSEENFQRVLMKAMRLVFGTSRQEPLEIQPRKRRRPLLDMFINLLYLLSFLFSFGLLIWLLLKLDFSVLSIAVFLLFISLVAFAGTRIRARGRELMLGEEKQGLLYTFFDLFSLPVIQTGRWLSKQVARYNILIVIFNFLLEIPFQVFVEFLEQWRSFLREKREEVH